MGSIKTTIYLFSLLLLLALVVLSCSKKEITATSESTFLFGTTYQNCVSNCNKYYAIRNGNIYRASGEYLKGPMVIGTEALTPNQYDLGQKVVQDLPDYLENNPEETFGCPECENKGGIHIEYIRGSGLPSIRKWHIDTDTAAIPAEIRPYAIQILKTIDELEKY